MEHEVFFVLDGEMELVFENGSARYTDSGVVVPAGIEHYSVVDSERLFVIYLSPENCETKRLFEERLGEIFSFSIDSEQRFYLDVIARERSDEDRVHVLSLLFSSFMGNLAPDTAVVNSSPSDAGRYPFDIDEFISERYSEEMRLPELARHLHLCEKQVSRVIKREYNCSFSDLVKRKRLSVASMMLKHTELTVSEIARSVGFENINYFYSVFKREFGETPTEYRSKQKTAHS